MQSGSLTLQLLCVLVIGLMCGSELNVAAFGHPTLNRQPLEVHIPVRAALANLFGRVMPFWMTGSALLNLILLLPFEGLAGFAWRLTAVAFAIQIGAIIFSLAAPVPINNRISRWISSSLPGDWKKQEHLWDIYHWFRTAALVIAFGLLSLSLATR